MGISITKNLKDKIFKLGCILLFLFIFSVLLDIILNFIPFKSTIYENYVNMNSVAGFPEVWSNSESDGILSLLDAASTNSWVFDISDYTSNSTSNNSLYNDIDISANVNKNKSEYSYFSDAPDGTDIPSDQVSYIILGKDITLTRDIKYKLKTYVNIGNDALGKNSHYVKLYDSSLATNETIYPDASTKNDIASNFYTIEHDFIATSTNMRIELVSEMRNFNSDRNRVIWKQVDLTFGECDTTKCEFKACGGVNNPMGYTGNFQNGILDLPEENINNVSYYYKYINHSCKSGSSDCYANTTCAPCLPGKLLLDKNTRVNIGYAEPGGSTMMNYPDCSETNASLPSDFFDESDLSFNQETTTATSDATGDPITLTSVVENVASGGLQSIFGSASVLGGMFQSLGGGLYAIYDYDTGRANVVNGAGTTVAGAENIVAGLIDAGRLPTNALFGAVGVDLVQGDIEEKAKMSESEVQSNNSLQGLPQPYVQSISF